MIKADKFISDHKITIKNVHSGTVREGAGVNQFVGDAWKSTIKMHGRRCIIPFTKGCGHKGAEPTIKEVLSSMVIDSASITNYDIDEFIREFGYDCKQGKKVYAACEKQKTKLEKFAGELYDELMYGVDFD